MVFGYLEPYFTDEARTSLATLQQAGADYDLAVSMLEAAFPEGALYDIPVFPEELSNEAQR